MVPNTRFMVKVVVVKASGFVLMLMLSSKNYGSSWIQHEAVKNTCKAENNIIILINLHPTFVV